MDGRRSVPTGPGDVEARTVWESGAEGQGGGAEPAEGGRTRAAEGRVELEATPERVWRALTEAAELERWFPLEAGVEPGEGGEIFMSWKNEFAGSSEILSWDPPRHLRLAWGGTGAQVTDYHLEGEGGTTVLRVVTSGFPEDASWDEWVEGTRLGWLFELTSLKRYLEHHDGGDRRVVYLRRRIGLDRQEAWDRLFGPEGFDPGAHGGRALYVEEPRQYVAVTEDPAGALLRLSTEPCGPGVEGIDVTFFLSVWGAEGGADVLAVVESGWEDLLERIFPDGEWM